MNISRRLVLAIALAACIAPQACDRGPVADFKVRRIAMVGPGPRSGFWSAAHASASAEVLKLRGTLVTYAGPATVGDGAGQAEAVTRAILEKPDILIIAPTGPAVLTSALAQTRAAGIPTIVLSTDAAPDAAVIASIAPDAGAIGAAAAGHLAPILEKGAEVLIVHGAPGESSELVEAAFAAEARKSGLKVADPGIRATNAAEREALDTYLQSNPAAAIFAPNPAASRSVRDVLRIGSRYDRVLLVAVGGDDGAIEALATGEFEAIVAIDPVETGRMAAQAAIDQLSGQQPQPVRRPRFVLVTRKNMQDPGVKEVISPEFPRSSP